MASFPHPIFVQFNPLEAHPPIQVEATSTTRHVHFANYIPSKQLNIYPLAVLDLDLVLGLDAWHFWSGHIMQLPMTRQEHHCTKSRIPRAKYQEQNTSSCLVVLSSASFLNHTLLVIMAGLDFLFNYFHFTTLGFGHPHLSLSPLPLPSLIQVCES